MLNRVMQYQIKTKSRDLAPNAGLGPGYVRAMSGLCPDLI
jgi:hypothetical protein